MLVYPTGGLSADGRYMDISVYFDSRLACFHVHSTGNEHTLILFTPDTLTISLLMSFAEVI